MQGNPFQNPGQAPAFGGFDDAEVEVPYLASGTSLVEIEYGPDIVNLDDMGGLTAFVTFRVLQSTNPANPVGELRKYKRSQLAGVKRSGKNMGELRSFVGTALGVDPNGGPPQGAQSWDQVMGAVCGGIAPGNPEALKGRRLLMFGVDKETKFKPIVVFKFAPAPAQ